MTTTATITFPRHTNPDALSVHDRRIWDDMTTALLTHEMNHIQHGIQAADEIRRANCRGGNAIIRKWANEDRAYDSRTRNGVLEGVDLR